MSAHPTGGPGTVPVQENAIDARYRRIRATTTGLVESLTPEDCVLQSMPDASPTKWHLAHTTWFFETFLLEREVRAYRPFHESFRYLFNSYYNTVGEQYPRPLRGLISRPSLSDVLEYRQHVDRHILQLLADQDRLGEREWKVMEVGLNHEQQHQELMLMDVKHLFHRNPLKPAYRACPAPPRTQAPSLRWRCQDEGVWEIGHAGHGFAFDNECPKHKVFAASFEIASRLATCGEFLDFVKDRGYERSELWLSDGWDTVMREEWMAPLYWELRDGRWFLLTLAGERELRPEEPVCHVSYYEAEAFARWSGARLPTEAEWEIAAAGAAKEGNFLEQGLLHPAPAPASDETTVPAQLFGDVWEWTGSAHAPYPGYRPLEGGLGEYNGKFMANQMVLRGGACVTPRSHVRATYRNFFYPHMRWQFGGIRLARDAQ